MKQKGTKIVYDCDEQQMTKLKYVVYISGEAPSVTHRRDTSISCLGHPKMTRTIKPISVGSHYWKIY